MKNVIHFPVSPVKILSAVSLSEQLQDDLDTWILSRRKFSIFTWAKGEFSCTINHGTSRLPELTISSTRNNVDALSELVAKSSTSSNQLVYRNAVVYDRDNLGRDEDEAFGAFNVKSMPNDLAY